MRNLFPFQHVLNATSPSPNGTTTAFAQLAGQLAKVSSNPMLTNYIQQLTQGGRISQADWLSPVVATPTATGQYKKLLAPAEFTVASTVRGIGGEATKITYLATQGRYDCTPHALDFPLDVAEIGEATDLFSLFQMAATSVKGAARLAHEVSVLSTSILTLNNGISNVTAPNPAVNIAWSNNSNDPIALIDSNIIALKKQTPGGDELRTCLLFGPTAWNLFRQNTNVRSRFIVGQGAMPSTNVVTMNNVRGLFIDDEAECRTAWMVNNVAMEGLPFNLDYVIDSQMILFLSQPNPSLTDNSFMKTFRQAGKFMVPGFYVSPDQRQQVAKFDWSEQVQVTNPNAAILFNVS